MLKQRVLTAIVLLAFFLPALFWPSPLPLAALLLVLVAAAGWEWGRLNGLSAGASLGVGAATLMACVAAWVTIGLQRPVPQLWAAASLCWVLSAVALLRGGVAAWARLPQGLRLGSGVLALVLTWLAAVQARAMGANFLLSALALVWAADIGAYAVGKAFGQRWFRRKLAPSISPGKSWEGAIGGCVAVGALAALWQAMDARSATAVPSLFTQLASLGPVVQGAGLLVLVALSVAGDLVESLVKRSAGVKDSSALLPGHGGVLDRIDALLPTLPLALLVASLAAR